MTTTTTGSWRAHLPAKGLASILDYAAASHRHAVAVLVAIALCAFLPGFFQIPPVDREEARFAQTTRQILDTGDYVDIGVSEGLRYQRPAGIYWLQAAVVGTADALGVRRAHSKIWLYRIPSLVGALGAVLLTYWCALAFVSRRSAVLAGIMIAGSILLGVEARLAKADAMLPLTVVAAMGALARVYLAGTRTPAEAVGWTVPAIFWTALAAGAMLNGPLILLVVGLAIIALAVLDRSARWLIDLRPAVGIVWFLALVLPWFAIAVSRGDSDIVVDLLGTDLLARFTRGPDMLRALPGFHFALFWIAFWPAATLAGLAARVVWSARKQPAARFLLAWIVPFWIVLELVLTKLPHLALPLYPAIAILIAGAVEVRILARDRWLVRGTIWWFILPALASIALIVAAVIVSRSPAFLAWPFIAGAAIFGLLAWRLYDVDGAERSLLRATAASVLLAVATYGIVVPSLGALFPSASLAQVLRNAGCARPASAAAGFSEPSLGFLAAPKPRFTDGSGAADFLHQGGCRFAFIEARQQRAFLQRADSIGLHYNRGPRIEGFNYSVGRQVSIAVYRSEPRP